MRDRCVSRMLWSPPPVTHYLPPSTVLNRSLSVVLGGCRLQRRALSMDLQRLAALSAAAQQEEREGTRYGDALAAFLVEFDHPVLYELVAIAVKCEKGKR